jgi:hypothetical protein
MLQTAKTMDDLSRTLGERQTHAVCRSVIHSFIDRTGISIMANCCEVGKAAPGMYVLCIMYCIYVLYLCSKLGDRLVWVCQCYLV